MLRAFAVVTVSVVLLLSIAIPPAGAHGRGGFAAPEASIPPAAFKGSIHAAVSRASTQVMPHGRCRHGFQSTVASFPISGLS